MYSNSCCAAYLHEWTFCFNVYVMKQQSSEEWHIAACPCSSEMSGVCNVNTYFVVIYCHTLNGNQLFQFRDLSMKLLR
jgi:hypothetical protein